MWWCERYGGVRCGGVRGVVVWEVWWCERCGGVRGVVV